MRIRAIFGVVVCAVTPAAAQAWEGELLCRAPEVQPLESARARHAHGPAMCLLTAPHLLRGPGYNDCAPVSGREAGAQAPRVARRALRRARTLEQSGLFEDALLNLRVVEATLPRIADHVAMMRAELHERADDPASAASAYADAAEAGNNYDLSARARVGRVLNLMRADSPDAVRELEVLLDRYPSLPEAPALRLELGGYYERAANWSEAVETYRKLDLELPGYGVAIEARARLSALRPQVPQAPYTLREQVERVERLVRSGPLELAQPAFEALLDARLPSDLASRFEAVRERLSDRAVIVTDLEMLNADQQAQAERDFHEKLRLAIEGAKLRRLRPRQALALLQEATRLGQRSICDELLAELVRRARHFSAATRFDALTVAIGSASEASVVALADTLLDHRTYGVAARYHRARALERDGRIEDARAELLRVMELDDSATHFYRHWAEQRLTMLSDVVVRCFGAGRSVACNRGTVEAALAGLEVEEPVDVSAAVAMLEPLTFEHGAAYPWLPRALDLLYVGEVSRATDELHEAYLAYRSAIRASALRAGVPAIYRGGAGDLYATRDAALKRARRKLDRASRESLAEVLGKLGDVGTAAFFGGSAWRESHPRPYASEVARVARKYGLDPDLLFAVMRVESVYQRRIVSRAGAIGLMQIMPRTGRLIASRLGRIDTTATDLLNPSVNLEFSAWYLSSLLKRMDGRLPLAIASYNGGPHNVRRWIEEFGAHIPLDAFLERIPFRETKRYVRRVLSYYADYRAERGHKLDLMAMTLPKDRPDIVSF